MKKVFLDTETTDIAPGQIAQLSMIIEEDNGNIYAKNYFFSIGFMSDEAKEVCGRGADFYRKESGGKVFADYKDEILDELKDSTLIAHNLKFDENFISTEFWRQDILFTPADRFDTMKYFRNIVKIPYKQAREGKYKNPKLAELVDSFSVNKTKIEAYSKNIFNCSDSSFGFHDARYDTAAMFVVFQIYRDSLYNRTSWKDTFCI